MKKVIYILLICFVSVLYAQENSFSIVNDNNVNLRDFPSVSRGKVIEKLKKNQKIEIYIKILETDNINGIINNWYYVTIENSKYGWIFGEYISVGNPAYKYMTISIKREFREYYAKQLIKAMFGKSISDEYPLKDLEKYPRLSKKRTTFWQMSERGYEDICIYSTDYGELCVWVNSKNEKYQIDYIRINRKDISEYFKLLISEDVMRNNLGSDYSERDGLIIFNQNSETDMYYFECKINNGTILEYRIARFFD